MIFREFTNNWFVYGVCPYYTIREAKGRTYSRSSIDNKRRILYKHLLPVFGELRLDHITTDAVEIWLIDLKNQGYAINSINIYFSLLNMIIREAVRTGYLYRNPCMSVIRFSEEKSERGIFSNEEIEALFGFENNRRVWKSRMQYLINLTAANTGCRIGEILALTKDKLHENYIEVSSSYDRKYGLKSTKNGETRYIPISFKLYKMLLGFSATRSGKFIFSKVNNPFNPVNYSTVNHCFKEALRCIGISDEKRKQRCLSFHTYRHFVNTRLRESGLPDAITRKIIPI